MALGNRGSGLSRYAQSLYDDGHQGLILYFAHMSLAAALAPKAKYADYETKQATAFFAAQKANIESAIDVERAERVVRMDGFNMGSSKSERQYRQWTLREGLFLNPLNDLGAHSIAARDMLSLPSFATPIGEPPSLISFFDHRSRNS
jgi:hypothetical protein